MVEKHKEEYIRIGRNIKSIRESNGWSQQYLANKTDKIDRAKISDIENGKEDFMYSTLLEISIALNTSVSELTA